MQTPYLDYAPTAKWYRNHSHNLHKNKLREIQENSSRTLDQRVPKSLKMLPKIKYNSKLRESAIQKENQILLNRIKDMSTLTDRSRSSNTVRAVSLNYTSRKKEAKRIVEENEALAKRLNQVHSIINRQLLKKDYQSSVKYRKISSKKRMYEQASSEITSQKLKNALSQSTLKS